MFLINYFAIFTVLLVAFIELSYWLLRIFLLQNFGWAVTNGTLSFYECRLSDEDTLNLLHSDPMRMLEHLPHITKTINFVRKSQRRKNDKSMNSHLTHLKLQLSKNVGE